MNLPDESLPPHPERPDCCGGGCAVCVLDSYQDDVERWEKAVAEILEQRKKPPPQVAPSAGLDVS